MPEPITKHAFVDDNPYIAYTGEPETTVSGDGGGSVGGSAIPIIIDGAEGYICSMEYSALKAGILSGDIVFGFALAEKYHDENINGWQTTNQGNGITKQLVIMYDGDPEEERIDFAYTGESYCYYPDGTVQYID